MLGASVKSWTQEYDAGKILLPEDTPEAFDAAIKFLTSNVIPPCLVNSSHPGSPKAIATLYIFADRYLLGDLMEQVEECIEDTANSNKCTCVEIVYEILETLPASTPGLDMLLEQTMQMVFQDMTEDEAERVKELVASGGEFASVALQGSVSNSKALVEERDDALNEVTTTTNTLKTTKSQLKTTKSQLKTTKSQLKTTKAALDKSEEINAELEERVEVLEEDDGGAENVQAELDAEEAAHEQTKRDLRQLKFNVDLVQKQIGRAVLREQEMEKLFHQYRRGEKTLEQVAYHFGSADEE
jgi:hypothetical protein